MTIRTFVMAALGLSALLASGAEAADAGFETAKPPVEWTPWRFRDPHGGVGSAKWERVKDREAIRAAVAAARTIPQTEIDDCDLHVFKRKTPDFDDDGIGDALTPIATSTGTHIPSSSATRPWHRRRSPSMAFRSPDESVCLDIRCQSCGWRAWRLGPIFAQLLALNRKLRGAERRGREELALSIVPSFASRWLVPRLGRFLEVRPEVDLRISAVGRLVDFASEPVDLGIRYGRGRYPGLAIEKIADDAWVVVAAPALLGRRRPRTPRDLAQHLLIHDDEPGALAGWLARQGVAETAFVRRTEISDSSMLVDAAVRAQGIALARWSLAIDELATGRLELVFPRIAPWLTGQAYYLVAPRENLRRPSIAQFWSWVLREAASLRAHRLA